MNTQKLTPRLYDVASLTHGGFVADVGTDHAFLPIYLIESRKATRALATDIRQAPLSRAEKNIAARGLADKIETMLTGGLDGLEKYPLDCIVIAGMGGLNIIEILSAADFVRERKTRLVLQPMQNVTELRRYLACEGFNVEKELITIEDDKVYQIMSAVYDGAPRALTPAEELLGAYNIEHKSMRPREFIALCERQVSSLDARINGLETARRDASREREIRKIIENEKTEAEALCQM
ncbi:MAG: SAM-dependent methyltransferase [Clostridia bacterium]|nr:SAM-dependent methyltransferase [Clostridia bacterium]